MVAQIIYNIVIAGIGYNPEIILLFNRDGSKL